MILNGQACDDCTAGQYSNEVGQVACKACSIGQTLVDRFSACVDCESGKYSVDGQGEL